MALRLGWLVLVILAIALWIVGTIENTATIPADCAAGTCDPFALSAGDLAALAGLNLPVRSVAAFFAVSNIGIALAFFTIGGLIAWRKSADWMGLLVSFTLVYLGAAFFTDSDDALWRAHQVSRPVLTFLAMLGYAAIMLLLFYFPDGRFIPHGRAARLIGWLIILFTAPFVGTATRMGAIGAFPLVATVGLGLAAQVYRYWQVSGPEQRQQTKWVVFGLASSLIVMLLWLFAGAAFPPGPPSTQRAYFLLFTRPLISVLIPLLPVSIAFSILRYRLWDIDIIINRTLVYALLTACVIAIFVLIVGGLGTLLQSQGNPLIALLATGLVAVLFQPLRERLQRGVNRLIYGERDDPLGTLSQLGRRLEAAVAPDVVLPSLVETVSQTLKLPYVAISLRNGDEFKIAARTGVEVSDALRLPLIYQGETVGQLIAGPRGPGESFDQMDRQLLENIAHQAGPAAYAVQLAHDLRRSRVRLVTAREEERRRLRRDLHDGLGPVLASQGLKMAAVSQLLQDEPAKARRLLKELAAQNEATVAEIRRLVYALRPAALDNLGLVGAIYDYASGLKGRVHGSPHLQVEVQAPASDLPPLPAAIEVAAYRIATEALANVTRHARARRATVSLVMVSAAGGQNLHLEIADDGIGLPGDHKAGIGVISMRERAEEVGGTFLIKSSSDGGTRVAADLPLPQAHD